MNAIGTSQGEFGRSEAGKRALLDPLDPPFFFCVLMGGMTLCYTVSMENFTWYATLIKPTWAPPAWLFGSVWSVLYIIIALSFAHVFYRVYQGEIPLFIGALFALNLVSNLIFTPLQFGLQSNVLASIDIIVVLVSLVLALYYVYPYAAWVMYVNLPYLLWVIFATILQLTITYLNW